VFSFWNSLAWRQIRMGSRRPRVTIDLTGEEELSADDGSNPIFVCQPAGDVTCAYYKCPICFHPLENPVATMCGHIFCHHCLTTAMDTVATCPLCKRFLNLPGPQFIRIYL
ncbi:hypothetical protein KR009_001253, partial [Drosophila setifemur]